MITLPENINERGATTIHICYHTDVRGTTTYPSIGVALMVYTYLYVRNSLISSHHELKHSAPFFAGLGDRSRFFPSARRRVARRIEVTERFVEVVEDAGRDNHLYPV